MKSIVEEASSVMKAIEKGWVQAGKPQEFSVKVFEIEQKNFLGLTSKPAKIAILYGQPHSKAENRDRRSVEQARRTQQRPQHQPHRQTSNQQAESVAPQQSRSTYGENQERKERQQQPPREMWTQEMIDAAQQWLTQSLRLAQVPHKPFTVESKNYYLKFNFEGPLLSNPEKERLLFRSIAHLVMQTLRNKFKKGFRGFKIILNTK